MKKLIMVFGLFFGLLFTFGLTTKASETTTTADTAQETTGNLPSAGITPDSALYRFDKFFENVSLKFTFSNEKRAEKLSKFAEERLAEINALDPAAADKYSEELFNEYGLDVEKAHIYVQQLVAEGKLSDAKLQHIENRIQKAEMKQEKIKAEVKEKISEEVRNQIHEAIQNAKMSVFQSFDNLDEMKVLHDEGYGYGELLKLQAISELSEQSVTDILAIENATTTDENNNIHINFDVILEATGVTQDALNEKLQSYRTQAKTEMKNAMSEAKKNAEARRQQIKEQIKQRIEQKKQEKNQNKGNN